MKIDDVRGMTPDQLAESLLNLKKEQFIQEAEFTPSGVVRIAKLPEVKERLANQGMEPAHTTPEAFAKAIRDDSARWGKVVQSSGAQLD